MYGFIGGKRKIWRTFFKLILGVFVGFFLGVLGLLGSIGSKSFLVSAETSDLVINEVYYHGGSDAEWVEIYNIGETGIDLINWVIRDNYSSDTVATSSLILPPDTFAVIVGSKNNEQLTASEAIKIVLGNTAIGNGLASGGDRIVLEDSGGNPIDQMSYGDNTEFCGSGCLDVASGHSLERIPFGTGDFKDQSDPTPGSGVTERTEEPSDQEESEEGDEGESNEAEETELAVGFSAPSEVTLGEEFEIEVSLENAESGRNYHVKFGANDGTLDYGKFSKGYTWSNSKDKFLPFIGGGYSWSDFPSLSDSGGTIRVMITRLALAGDCAVVVRVEGQPDSGVRMIRAQEAEEEVEEDGDDSGDSEGAEESGEVLGETTTTGTKTSAKKTSSSKSYAFGPFGKNTQQATVSPILSATSSADHEATPSTESAFSTPSGEEGSSKFSIISKILLAFGGLVILGVLGFSIAKKRGLV